MDPVGRFLEWAILKLYDHKIVDGLHLHGNTDELDRVVEALSLIKHHDPIRYVRICRDLKHVEVAVLAGRLGEYDTRSRRCRLERRYVMSQEVAIALIASVIVHEATHARLHRAGITYDEGRRSRIENICFRREIAFGVRLPEGGEVVNQARRSLEAAYDFSDPAQLIRWENGQLEALRYLGLPSWLVPVVATTARWFRRWKSARRRETNVR